MPLPAPDFESGASTSSATSAKTPLYRKNGAARIFCRPPFSVIMFFVNIPPADFAAPPEIAPFGGAPARRCAANRRPEA